MASHTVNKTAIQWFLHIFSEAKQSLSELPRWERGFHIFWLLGPFIMLIERSPADLWLSVLALSFVVRSILKKEGAWLRAFWVKAAFAFWGVTILSGLLSSLPVIATSEAVAWFRFPLFAAATVYWFGRDKRLLHAMYLATFLGLLMMCCILSAEVLIEGQKNGRLMWPYGDLVPGNYVAKVGMPAFNIMVALAVSMRGQIAYLAAILALFTTSISLLTGERINFLISICGGILAGMVWKPIWSRYILVFFTALIAVILIFQFLPHISYRYIDHFIHQIPTGEQSSYYKAMLPGIMAFMEAPIFGVGTGNMRHLCMDIITSAPQLECHPHPHHFYIQLAAETGIFGLITGTVFLWSIVWRCFQAGLRNRDNILIATAWVIPFGLFWPIASFADFFGQWNNIFMWSALAVALASAHLSPKT